MAAAAEVFYLAKLEKQKKALELTDAMRKEAEVAQKLAKNLATNNSIVVEKQKREMNALEEEIEKESGQKKVLQEKLKELRATLLKVRGSQEAHESRQRCPSLIRTFPWSRPRLLGRTP